MTLTKCGNHMGCKELNQLEKVFKARGVGTRKAVGGEAQNEVRGARPFKAPKLS